MLNIDTPSIINVNTPEQNIQAIKGWAEALVSELQYKIYEMEDKISSLEMEISQLKEGEQ